MITSDLHIHSNFSYDAISSVENIVKSALNKKLNIIAITDHIDLNTSYYSIPMNIAKQQDEINRVQKIYPNIKILKGVELGLNRDNFDITMDYISNFNFDIKLVSVHEFKINDDYIIFNDNMYNNIDIQIYLQKYLEEVLYVAKKLENFNILTHLDFPLRYLTQNNDDIFEKQTDLLQEIFSLLINKQIALEINTGGFYSFTQRQNPSLNIIMQYFKQGAKLITFGSDAHQDKYIANKFDNMEQLLINFDYQIKY